MPELDTFTYQHFRRISFREKTPGSPEFSYAPDQGRATRQWYIPWEQGRDALEDLLGFSTVEVAGGTKYISRVSPHEMPGYEGFYYAASMPRVEGDIPAGKDGKEVGQFDEAKTTVVYEA